MHVHSARIVFRIGHASSLKDKRQVARSVMDKAKNKFNASIAEVDDHDAHQRLVIGIALVAAEHGHGQKCLDEILRYMEENANAELLEVEIWQD